MSNIATQSSMSTRIHESLRRIPLATLLITSICTVIYVVGLFFPSKLGVVCNWPAREMYDGWFSAYRMVTAAYFHTGFLHILFNMMAFVPLGTFMEHAVGTVCFLANVLLFGVLANVLHFLAALALAFNPLISYPDTMNQCAAGLSTVIFTLLVIQVHHSPPGNRSIFGMFSVPSRLYPFVLLVVYQFVMPNVSFLGHLAGIVVGLLYCYGFLNLLQLSPRLTSAVEGSCLCERFYHRNAFISNPAASSLPPPVSSSASSSGTWSIPGNALARMVQPARPETTAFSGVGYTLGRSASSSAAVAPPSAASGATMAQMPPKPLK